MPVRLSNPTKCIVWNYDYGPYVSNVHHWHYQTIILPSSWKECSIYADEQSVYIIKRPIVVYLNADGISSVGRTKTLECTWKGHILHAWIQIQTDNNFSHDICKFYPGRCKRNEFISWLLKHDVNLVFSMLVCLWGGGVNKRIIIINNWILRYYGILALNNQTP